MRGETVSVGAGEVSPDQVLGETCQGRKVVVTGDTGPPGRRDIGVERRQALSIEFFVVGVRPDDLEIKPSFAKRVGTFSKKRTQTFGHFNRNASFNIKPIRRHRRVDGKLSGLRPNTIGQFVK